MNVIKVKLDDVAFAKLNGTGVEDMYGVYQAQPAVFMIEKLNAWKVEGHKIVIETNRDVETEFDITHKWLDHYEVPYDELVWVQ